MDNISTRLAGSRRRKRHNSLGDSDSGPDDTETRTILRPLSKKAKWSRYLSDDDDDHTEDNAMSALLKPSRSKPGVSIANISSERRNKDQKIKRSNQANPPHPNRPSEPGSDSDVPLASKASASAHKTHTVISVHSSPEPEQQKKNTTTSEDRTSKKTNTGPDSITQKTGARVKDEPLSPDIIDHTVLRVKADGLSNKARGPITVNFEVYKTSERLFTSLMSERSLKPEIQKKVLQLTATVNGKETCCRRSHFNDWTEVCRELRKLWVNSPELFYDRFEMDVMLHVEE